MKIDVHREDARGNVFTLLEPIETSDFVVPIGFESDGASVPRLFWRLVFPPTDTRAIRAAVIHDWLYRNQPAGWTRKMADDLFRQLLIDDGVEQWRAWLAWAGIRLGGWIAWGANKSFKEIGAV